MSEGFYRTKSKTKTPEQQVGTPDNCGHHHSVRPPLNGPIDVFDADTGLRRMCTHEDVVRANPHLNLDSQESSS
ncbi:MAG: hypothetical protein GEU78_15020 [Actinobacteria bacterium]|nr:hypothetical protein [Actinomycetota bacterium]